MQRVIMLIPTETNVSLTSISLGVTRAMEREGLHLNVFKSIDQHHDSIDTEDRNISMVLPKKSNRSETDPLTISYIESLLARDEKSVVMEKIIAKYYENTRNAEVVLVEGLIPSYKHQFSQWLNFEIAKALNAEIVFVMDQRSDTFKDLKKRIELTQSFFGGVKNKNIIGVIINKLNAPVNERNWYDPEISEIFYASSKETVVKIEANKLCDHSPLPVLGAIPWSLDFIAVRAIDVARHLNAIVINAGDINTRRVTSITFCTHSISNILPYVQSGSLVVTSIDCLDVTSCFSILNRVEISAILLIGVHKINNTINKLYKYAYDTGLPIFMVNRSIWQISLNLNNLNLEVSSDDYERIEKIQEYVADYISTDWVKSMTRIFNPSYHLSPIAFCYQITELARKARKRIILPEGDEPRTVKAAIICAKRGIATCILVGNPNKINQIAASQGIDLSVDIEIINPERIRETYVAPLVALRKNKGMTESIAREQLKDNVVLGTMMLEQDEVDGLVSGAVHTTANTIRPALQLTKTAPGNSLISSIFFMLMPEQVYVYGDCAINPDPTAAQLAEIAIQSAESAITFGIEPYVAMLSYSTGTSATGSSVEKVRQATQIAKKKRPDLIIDGPMQYDAAVMIDVAKSKSPNSPVAGHATVFIFPDLNAGNITYKAVQRSADLISIGPMLQGMRKPVNDLSRGALVDDIVYTIALTAIQSSRKN